MKKSPILTIQKKKETKYIITRLKLLSPPLFVFLFPIHIIYLLSNYEQIRKKQNKNRFIDYSSYNFHYHCYERSEKRAKKKNGRKKKVEDTRGKILTTALTIKNSQGRSMTQTPCFSNVASIPRDIVTEEEEREEKKRTWKREVSRCSLVSRFPIPLQPPS